MSSRYSNRRPSGRRRTSHLLLGLGLFVGLSTFWYNSNRLEATEGTPRDKSKTVQFAKKSPPERCWVFHHLNKAGGSTLKYMFQSWAEAQEDISPALYDSVQWMKGEKFAREFIDEQHAFMMGAYAEGLRPRGGGKGCKWFTVFRHPIPRMVSAYIYCKKGAVDGLCASSVLRANTTDLNTFAEHWGNYALRQFSLAYVLPEDVITAELESENRCMPRKGEKGCPSWYRLKLYLEELHQKAEAGKVTPAAGASLLPTSESIMKDGAMLRLIEPVSELLNKEYAAVGILEEWDSSLKLFDASLKLPDFDFREESRKVGKKNGSGRFKEMEKEALAIAWTDPGLRKHLLLDLVLYDHAVSVHKRQIEEYGL